MIARHLEKPSGERIYELVQRAFVVTQDPDASPQQFVGAAGVILAQRILIHRDQMFSDTVDLAIDILAMADQAAQQEGQ